MTVSSELRRLRRESLPLFTGDPMDIPCIETSDPGRLCAHPLVSVCMITYNHEPYLRQAIEGVLMQKTDFDFELVIGEDCSTDRTREICFEYQKRYPEKIRVLWAKENVFKLGGNGNRTRAHCRGEFIAMCEGDDYWTDPRKLQKQVDIMRKYQQVTFCCHRFSVQAGDAVTAYPGDRTDELIRSGRESGGFLFNREEFFFPSLLAQTATIMYRKSAYDTTMIRKIGLLYDWIVDYVLLEKGFGFFINETMSIYRQHAGGMWSDMSKYERVLWSLRRAMRLYEVDPTPVSKRQLDDWIANLRPFCTPFREWYAIRAKIRLKSRIRALLPGLF